MSTNRLFIFIFALLFIPSTVWGASIVRTGEMVSIAPDQVVEDDFYGMGNTVVVTGDVTSDLLALSADMTVNGKVGSDMTVATGRLDIHGSVGDDVRVFAGEVLIAGEVKGDLVVIAKTLNVLPTAKIDGDLMFFGTDADIAGVVGGDIFGNNERMRVDADVKGGIDVTTTSLTLGDKAKIGAGVTYVSANELVRAQNAQVTNDVVRNDPVISDTDTDIVKNIVILFLITSFASLVWYLFFKGFLQRIVINSRTNVLKNALIGFGVLFLLPIASTILILSTLGSILGILFLVTYMCLLVVSFITLSVVAGAIIARTSINSGEVSIPFILLGAFSVNALFYVPVLGPIILIGLLLITLGAVSVNLFNYLRIGS